MAHPQFEAVNLISDPIHGYIELTKRLTPEQSGRAGLAPESVAEEDLLDTPWLQRLRRISQLQSARWVFPTAEHSRFTHGLGVMHEAGLWGRALYPTLREVLLADTLAEGEASEDPIPSEPLVVETLRMAGLLHDVGHGPFAHFFDEHVLARFPAPPHPSRDPAKRLSHEDLGQAIIERELGAIIGGLRRAPDLQAERAAFAEGESIEPRWIGFLLYEPGLGALEQFLASRLFMYNTVYFHRTVRAIDLDLEEVFGPSVRALFGDGNPLDDLAAYAALDEYALLHQASLWAGGRSLDPDPAPGSGCVTPTVGRLWRHVLLRQPTWRTIAEVRRDSRSGGTRAEVEAALVAGAGAAVGSELRLDLAEADGRPQNPLNVRGSLIVARRDGTLDSAPLDDLLERLPAVVVVGRAYARSPSSSAPGA